MKDPFGFPESSVERLLREERERTRLLGGGTAAQAILEATDVRKRLGLDFGAPYRGVLDMLERDRRQQLEFRQLTSSAWALSISETARSIVDRNAGLLDDQRRLSSSLLDTVKTFDLKRSTMASVIAAAATGGTYRRMIEEALPVGIFAHRRADAAARCDDASRERRRDPVGDGARDRDGA